MSGASDTMHVSARARKRLRHCVPVQGRQEGGSLAASWDQHRLQVTVLPHLKLDDVGAAQAPRSRRPGFLRRVVFRPPHLERRRPEGCLLARLPRLPPVPLAWGLLAISSFLRLARPVIQTSPEPRCAVYRNLHWA